MCECNCEDCPWLNLFIVVVTHHVIKIVYHLQVVFNADVFIGTMHTLLFGVINFNGHKTIDMITEMLIFDGVGSAHRQVGRNNKIGV